MKKKKKIKTKLDNFINNGKEKNPFGVLSGELLDRIWYVYRYCINTIYVLS